MTRLEFPAGFRWGTATAAHQIEGGNHNNDWWDWEHAPGTACVEPSGDACDSWHRWREDVAICRDLGVDDYRFSVEWSRIEPAPGEWSTAAVAHYREQCEALLAVGIDPVVTLHHFTSPRWIAAQGGWTNPATAEHFAAFAGRIMAELGPVVRRVCTVNEPNIVSAATYLSGTFPPGTVDVELRRVANRVFIDGHRRAVDAVRSAAPGVPVGITLALVDYQAVDGGEAKLERIRSRVQDEFLDALEGDDFVGVQTYSRERIGPDGQLGPEPGRAVVETMGYEVDPEAVANTVRYAWERTGGAVPILVTENGIATDDDEQRREFVRDALVALHACIGEGIDLRGYTYWSLLDNFEWAYGYPPRFGLVSVDRETFERTPKESARWYASVIAANAVDA